MRIVTQNYRDGKLRVSDVPVPPTPDNGILVRTSSSLISAGTERMITEIGSKSLIGKALARPDLVKRVIEKAKSDGLRETFRSVRSRLDQSIPLGYSSAGIITETNSSRSDSVIGQMVACFGAETASHAEFAAVPDNLWVRVPDGVPASAAAFAGVGAIAANSIAKASPKNGDRVAVVGLGLIGLMAVQILKSHGCQVVGVEPDPARATLALHMGAKDVVNPADSAGRNRIANHESYQNLDSVFIFASSSNNTIIALAADMLKPGGWLVVPGSVPLDLPREKLYASELRFIVPQSAGWDIPENANRPPGAPDQTVGANMSTFLELVSRGEITVEPLITDQLHINDAIEAYSKLTSGSESIGILLDYSGDKSTSRSTRFREPTATPSTSPSLRIGLVGSGQWARNTLIPELNNNPHANIAALVARQPANLEFLGKKIDVEYVTTDIQQLLDDSSIPAVVIATRNDSHAKLAAEALRAGKQVFVEKPPALNLDELSNLLDAADQSGNTLVTGFNRRFSPDALAARKFVGQERVVLTCTVNPGIIESGHWTNEGQQGGRIIGEMCHFADLLIFLAGSPAKRVSAVGIKGSAGEYESVTASILHRNGSISTLAYGAEGDRSYSRERVEVIGGAGVFIIDNFKGTSEHVRGKRSKKNRRGVDRGHKSLLAAYIDSARNIAKPTMSRSDIEHSMKLTFAIAESCESASTIEL